MGSLETTKTYETATSILNNAKAECDALADQVNVMTLEQAAPARVIVDQFRERLGEANLISKLSGKSDGFSLNFRSKNSLLGSIVFDAEGLTATKIITEVSNPNMPNTRAEQILPIPITVLRAVFGREQLSYTEEKICKIE